MIEEISTRVCIAGGGPAGMMLGLLLGRAGIDVVVLEKHADFFRDFRGDTVHPSTMNLIDQLGIRDAFERIPHARLPRLDAVVDGIRLHAIDFRSLPKPNREVTLMPQWDLLDLLAEEARRSPSFRLVMDADVTGVTWTGQRVTGLMAQTPGGELRVRADLTVAADGRDSTVRQALDLGVDQFGVPIDLTWFRLDRPVEPVPDTLGYLRDGSVLITIPRPEYLQCGLLIPKAGFSDVKDAGLGAFRDRIRRVAPRLGSVADGLQSWDQVKLLSVQIDRVQRWSRGGALCIGDAAHAMSPVFGVGINYAVQDAVAAANILVPVLRESGVGPAAIDRALVRVERRRRMPTTLMQRVQMVVHGVIGRGRDMVVLHNPPTVGERLAIRLVLPLVRPLIARLVGYGFRPERIDADVLGESGSR